METERQYFDIPFEIRAEDITEDGTFEGYGSLFDNSPDAFRDIINRGAFQETLAKKGRNGTGVALLWQHRLDKIPGVWISLGEDTKGLRVKGKLALDTQLGREVHSIMLLGAQTGTFKLSLSIGFDAVEFEFVKEKDADGREKPHGRSIRILKKVDLWEISIVTFPAKLNTTITTVKQIEGAKTIREVEEALRDSGWSKTEAQNFIAVCKAALRDSGTPDDNIPEDDGILSTILDSLKSINQQIDDNDMSGILNNLKKANS